MDCFMTDGPEWGEDDENEDPEAEFDEEFLDD